MLIISGDKIVEIVVKKEVKSNRYKWKDEKKSIFGRIVRKEGYYWCYLGGEKIVEDFGPDHNIKDGVVFIKPRVVIVMEAGDYKTEYFNTHEEALERAEELKGYIHNPITLNI